MTPVAFGREVAEIKCFLHSQCNAGNGAGDFAGDKCFTTDRAFVVKQDAVAGVQALSLAVVHIGGESGCGSPRAGPGKGGRCVWC
jgi:hypothetical protein